jgi:hypothetical protein
LARGPAESVFRTGGRGQHMFLVGASDENLVVIAAMLGAPPQQQKPKAHSSSDGVIRSGTPAPTRQTLERSPAGPLADAYGRFLELPVPAVLAALWILGVTFLGAAATAAYSVAIAIL